MRDEFTECDEDELTNKPPLPITTTVHDEYGIDEIDLSTDTPPVRCVFTTGAAGTGKTYYWRQRINDDPSEGELCATTGIAGVNLGTVTINSRLRYYDTESMINAYVSGGVGFHIGSNRSTSTESNC